MLSLSSKGLCYPTPTTLALKVATEVLVCGYPRRTTRYRTSLCIVQVCCLFTFCLNYGQKHSILADHMRGCLVFMVGLFVVFYKKKFNCIVPMGFLPWEIRVAFPVKPRLRQSRATQPTLHAGCFSVSLIHRTLTWTTGSLTCAQMLTHANAH